MHLCQFIWTGSYLRRLRIQSRCASLISYMSLLYIILYIILSKLKGASEVSSECCGNRTRAQVAFEQVDWHVGDIWYTLHVCETTNDRLPKDNSTITDCRVLGHFSHFYSACRMYVRMYFQRYTKIDLSWRNIEIEIEIEIAIAIESRD